MPWKLNEGFGTGAQDSRTQAADLKTVLLFFCYVVVVENVLVALWAWAIRGAPSGSDDRAFGFFAVYTAAMLCSGAAGFGGGFVGFLFGIPRSDDRVTRTTSPGVAGHNDPSPVPPSSLPPPPSVLPPPVPPVVVETAQVATPAWSGLRRNTNLETISDGLTKGLLGIGVSQLYRAPEVFRSVADAIGPAFGPGPSGKLVGMAVVLYGIGSGFFFGYLGTRIYLTRVFERSDPQ